MVTGSNGSFMSLKRISKYFYVIDGNGGQNNDCNVRTARRSNANKQTLLRLLGSVYVCLYRVFFLWSVKSISSLTKKIATNNQRNTDLCSESIPRSFSGVKRFWNRQLKATIMGAEKLNSKTMKWNSKCESPFITGARYYGYSSIL